MAATAEQVLIKALQEFQTSTVNSRLDRYSSTTLHYIQKQIVDIQSDQDKTKTHVNFTRYALFLQTFDQFDRACHAVEINIPGLASYVWASFRLILVMAREDVQVLDSILESYQEFGRHLPLLESYHDLLTRHTDTKLCLAWIYQDLLCFHGQLLKLFESNGWKRNFALKWNDYNDHEFKSLLRTVKGHGRFLQQLFDNTQNQMARDSQGRLNDHMIRSQDGYSQLTYQLSEIGDNFGDTQGRLNDLVLSSNSHYSEVADFIAKEEEHRKRQLKEAEQQEQYRKDSQYKKVIDWLHSAGVREPQTQLHNRLQGIHKEYPDTGKWIFAESKVDEWINADTPEFSVLWINGKKGAGKSVLASTIVEHLKTNKKDFKTSYFYCRDVDETLRESRLLAICKSLLTQMIEKQRSFLPILYQRCSRGRVTLEDESQAKALVELFCDEYMNQFIVLDGLDELESVQRRGLIDCVKTIVKKADSYKPGKIRILLVSTPLPEVRDLKKEDLIQVYDLELDSTQKDIEKYVGNRLKTLKDKYALNNEEIRLAERMACIRADGVFLFAFLVMENLLAQPNAKWLRRELQQKSFPKTINDVYDAIITRLQQGLHQNSWSEARIIFGWLACAKRPLMWHELQAALDMTVVDGEIEVNNNSGRLRLDIHEVCGSLVYAVEGKGLEFVHSSARARILAKEDLNEIAIECDMTQLCLKYLSRPCFLPSFDQERRQDIVDQGGYAFQDYAVSMWPSHLAALIEKGLCLFKNPSTGPEYDDKVSDMLEGFCYIFSKDFPSPPELAIGNEANAIIQAREYCQLFADRPFYESLVCIWTHIIKHDTRDTRERHLVSVKELREAFDENRKLIETSAKGPDEYFSELYGYKLYKCSRTACGFFHDGFDDFDARDHHSNRHDRPFLCTTPSCSLAPFGFSSDKDCQKHIRTYHFDTLDQPLRGRASPLPTTEAKYECTYTGCDRRFTRNMNLEAHVNAYHLGVRRFTCSSCDKRFTRNNDMVRHERDIHGRNRVRRSMEY